MISEAHQLGFNDTHLRGDSPNGTCWSNAPGWRLPGTQVICCSKHGDFYSAKLITIIKKRLFLWKCKWTTQCPKTQNSPGPNPKKSQTKKLPSQTKPFLCAATAARSMLPFWAFKGLRFEAVDLCVSSSNWHCDMNWSLKNWIWKGFKWKFALPLGLIIFEQTYKIISGLKPFLCLVRSKLWKATDQPYMQTAHGPYSLTSPGATWLGSPCNVDPDPKPYTLTFGLVWWGKQSGHRAHCWIDLAFRRPLQLGSPWYFWPIGET